MRKMPPGRPPKRRRSLFTLDRIEQAATAAVLAAILLWGGWALVRGPRAGARFCRERYAAARTVADTAMVDGQMVSAKPGIACGFYRRARVAPAPGRG